jgi:hypothetical protein
MFSRTNDIETGTALPKEWLEDCQGLLESVYKNQCKKQNRYFEVYGEIYKNELVFITSILNKDNINAIPITVSLSISINEKTDNKIILNSMVDASGMILDTIFNDTNTDDIYITNWSELKFKKHELYYKITRENILLTIEANKLLND